MNPRPPQSSIDASLDAMGVNPDVPILVRLWHWLTNLFTQFSLGTTVGGAQVTSEIAARSGASLRLLLIGSIIGAILGVVLGVWGAVRQYRTSDQIVTYASYIVFATPTFVIGVLLMILATQFNNIVGSQVITFTGEYTAGISGSWWDLAVDRAVHLLLPTLALVLIGAASFSRYQRSVMLDVLGAARKVLVRQALVDPSRLELAVHAVFARVRRPLVVARVELGLPVVALAAECDPAQQVLRLSSPRALAIGVVQLRLRSLPKVDGHDRLKVAGVLLVRPPLRQHTLIFRVP